MLPLVLIISVISNRVYFQRFNNHFCFSSVKYLFLFVSPCFSLSLSVSLVYKSSLYFLDFSPITVIFTAGVFSEFILLLLWCLEQKFLNLI